MSASILSRVSRKQNNSSLQHTGKTLKFKHHRILKPAQFSNMAVFDDRQISEQITQEMLKIDQIILTYKKQMQEQSFYRKTTKSIFQQAIELQKIIRQKDIEINSINEEIRTLKGSNLIHEPLKNSRQSVISPLPQVFTLAEELKNQGRQLKLLIEDHTQKTTNHKILYQAIKQIEKVFHEKNPKIEINYESFRQQSEQTRKQQEQKLRKRQLKIPTIRERMETVIEPSVMRGDNQGKGGIKYLLEKKKKMKLAIKNGRRKHVNQIMDLNAKLEFLRDEVAVLNEQIRQKESEKSNLEAKFNLNVRNRLKQKSKVSESQTVVNKNQYFLE